MPARGMSRAKENKRIRQEALREQLANKGLIQHVLELHRQLEDLDEHLEPVEVQRLRAVLDSQHKLIDKYLPSEKPVDVSGSGEDGEVLVKHVIAF